MFVAMVLGPVFGVIYLANNSADVYAPSIMEAIAKAGPQYGDWFAGASHFGKGIVVGNGLAWCVAYLGGLPQLNTRFMAIKDSNNAKSGRVISVTYIVLSYFGAVIMGFLGIAIFGPGTLTDSELVMPSVMMKIFPTALATLMITGGIAAMLSTADSLLALVSAEVSEDIIKPYFLRRNLSRDEGLRVSRIVTLFITAIALIVAYFIPQRLIFQIVSYVWAGLGNPFTVVTLLTLYWKKFNGKAALWTIIVGLFFTIFWIASGLDSKVITSMLAGSMASLLTAIVVTHFTQEKTAKN